MLLLKKLFLSLSRGGGQWVHGDFFLKASLIGKTAIKQLQGGLKALEHAKLSHVHYRENIHNIIFF